MIEFNKPIPLITPHGEGYAIYVESGGVFENDIFTCVLKETGEIKHYNTSQLKMVNNGTFDIKKTKMGLAEIQKIKAQALLPKVKKTYAIPKVSKKKKAENNGQRFVVDAELEKFYDDARVEMLNDCDCGCGNKTNKHNDKLFRWSICHIFPKRANMYPSIAKHPLNWVELASYGDCHNTFDGASGYEWAKTKPFLWRKIIERSKILYQVMNEREKNKVPNIILNEIL
jgi:hypothetical protein